MDNEVETPTAPCVTDEVRQRFFLRCISGWTALALSRGLVIAVFDFCPEPAILTRSQRFTSR